MPSTVDCDVSSRTATLAIGPLRANRATTVYDARARPLRGPGRTRALLRPVHRQETRPPPKRRSPLPRRLRPGARLGQDRCHCWSRGVPLCATAADLTRAEVGAHIDLTPYLAIINAVAQRGVGGELSLDAGERQRTEKRRLSLAATAQGYQLTWRTAPSGELRFVLARPGAARPGGRPRRATPPPPAARRGRARR